MLSQRASSWRFASRNTLTITLVAVALASATPALALPRLGASAIQSRASQTELAAAKPLSPAFRRAAMPEVRDIRPAKPPRIKGDLSHVPKPGPGGSTFNGFVVKNPGGGMKDIHSAPPRKFEPPMARSDFNKAAKPPANFHPPASTFGGSGKK